MSRATVDLQSIRFFLGYGLIFITQNLLTIVLVTVVMVVINPMLALIALAPAPLIVFTASRYNRVSRPALQEVQQRIAELTAEAEENISGIRIVKAFAREEHQLHRFRARVTRVFDQSIYSTRLQAFFSPLIGLLPQLGIALVLLIGGRQVIDGNLSLGDFTAFYTYMVILAGPMRMLGVTMGMAQRAIASGNRLFEILDREPRIESPPGAPPLPAGGGRVEMRGVSLAYEELRSAGAAPRRGRRGGPARAAAAIDLEVEAGRTVALVGPSGSGKTSLVALIARLYDPSEGTVSVDGADVREVDVGSLRREIAFVADDSFLFTASVAENIAYARPEASREEIEAAARRAQADAFIRDLPDGYETMVGERGLTLSGGQRQRVAIARALLADPRILILDDATSSVDATTEAAIKSGLAGGDGGPHDLRHRPPPLDRLARRRGDRHGRRRDRRPRHPRGAARGLRLLPRDRRARPRRLGLPAARPRGARGDGAAVSEERNPLQADLPALRLALAPPPRPGPARPQGALDDRPAAALPRPRWR